MAHPFRLQAAANGEWWLVGTALLSTLLLQRRHIVKGSILSIWSNYWVYSSRQYALANAKTLIQRKVDRWTPGNASALLEDIRFIADAGDLTVPAVTAEGKPPKMKYVETDEGHRQARSLLMGAFTLATITVQLLLIRSTYFKSIKPLGEM